MLIKNASIATETGIINADIRVSGEIITEVAPGLSPRNSGQVIDASGKIVIPGGVDAHTHMDLDLGAVRASDDFYTGTVAAAFGGTTSIVDHMAFGPKGCSIGHQVEVYHGLAGDKAVIDYCYHGVMDHVDDGIIEELQTLADDGIPSHKFYLTYGGMITDTEVLRLMERSAQLGVLLCVHAENDGSIAYFRDKCVRLGQTAPIYHARSRPPESEAEAVDRTLWLARMAGDAPLYIVHLSTALGLDCVRTARARGQKNIFVETCPQYLFLEESKYLDEDGLKYTMSPPLRTKDNCDALWEGIIKGDIVTIGTDHCPFFYGKEKQLGKDDFTQAPGGAPGVETRVPLMFSEVQSGKITLEKFVSICCAEPARLFGMYPKKGVIAVGSDADVVVIDPDIKKRITFGDLHENTDYTPYEGIEIKGYPVTTISRGEVIVQDGKFTGQKGRGKFIKCGLPMLGGV
jgi:dihydropyrimidinase